MTKKVNSLFLTVIIITLVFKAQAQTGYKNPVLRGFNPDPSICRVNDDYYLVTSSFEYFPGLPIYHSKDLVNWQQIGHCLTRESQLSLQKATASGGLYAPSLRYRNGTYYVICTNVSQGGNFYCTATNPAGPWSDPIWVGIDSIDPDIFWDEDGKTYFVTQGNEGIRITEIDIKTGKVLAPERLVWAGTGGRFPEGPHVYKKDGYYYLLLGEGGTEYAHSTTIGRSKNLFGPYEASPLNPIISHSNRMGQGNQIQGVGHADLVQTADGEWWAVFLGFRVIQPYSYYHILGRETFLAPVSWPKDGWPQVNGNGIINIDMGVPTLPLRPFKKPEIRTHFDTPALGLEWQYLRNPTISNYSLSERKGFLRISASPYSLNDAKPLSFVGRRQTEHNFTTATALEILSDKEDEEAGITLIQNNTHHYDFLIKRKGEKHVVQLRVVVGSLSYIAGEKVLENNKATLKITGSPLSYSFSFLNTKTGVYEEVSKLDTRYLSTEVAGGFTGVMIGMYASSNGLQTKAKAFYDWFDYSTEG